MHLSLHETRHFALVEEQLRAKFSDLGYTKGEKGQAQDNRDRSDHRKHSHPTMTPRLPITPKQIADEVVRCPRTGHRACQTGRGKEDPWPQRTWQGELLTSTGDYCQVFDKGKQIDVGE